MTPKGVFADARAASIDVVPPRRASPSRAPTARRWPRPRRRTPSASGSCCASSASTRPRSTASTSPAASRPTSTSRNAIEIGFLAPVAGRAHRARSATPRCAGARELLLSATARARLRSCSPRDRAHRARDHARLLRAVRRRLPVQAAARRRARAPGAADADDDGATRPGPSGATSVHRHRRERPHDAHRAPARAAASATDERGPRGDRLRRRATAARASCRSRPRSCGRRSTRRAASSTSAARCASRCGDGADARGRRSPTCARSRSGRSRPAPPSSTSTSTSTPTACPSRSRRWRGWSGCCAPIAGVPLSIDSSNLEIIRGRHRPRRARAGAADAQLRVAGARSRRSSSRPRRGGAVIVTAAGATGMPSDAEERVANGGADDRRARWRIGIPMELHLRRSAGLPDLGRRRRSAQHCLDAIRELRARYGPELHITGGMSNVCFGIPQRRLINDVFLVLAIEAGADSGIIDPDRQRRRARRSRATARRAPFQLALDVLTGADRNCRAYMKAFRAGELETRPVALSRHDALSHPDLARHPRPAQGLPRERPPAVACELADWFVQEIDRVAMREGIVGADEYLERWEWSGDLERPGTPDEVAAERDGRARGRVASRDAGRRRRGTANELPVLVTDYAWPSLDIERGILAEVGAELVVAEQGEPDELVALAAGVDAILTNWKRVPAEAARRRARLPRRLALRRRRRQHPGRARDRARDHGRERAGLLPGGGLGPRAWRCCWPARGASSRSRARRAPAPGTCSASAAGCRGCAASGSASSASATSRAR